MSADNNCMQGYMMCLRLVDSSYPRTLVKTVTVEEVTVGMIFKI